MISLFIEGKQNDQSEALGNLFMVQWPTFTIACIWNALSSWFWCGLPLICFAVRSVLLRLFVLFMHGLLKFTAFHCLQSSKRVHTEKLFFGSECSAIVADRMNECWNIPGYSIRALHIWRNKHKKRTSNVDSACTIAGYTFNFGSTSFVGVLYLAFASFVWHKMQLGGL